MEIIGIVVFALGILISVCLARGRSHGDGQGVRHEGHPVLHRVRADPLVVPARARPSTASRPIPLGAFVKIVGMTPQDDDVEPGDEKRAMWRYPVWKRTIVMSAGSAAHFVLGIVILWGLFAFVALARLATASTTPSRSSSTACSTCVAARLVEVNPADRAADELRRRAPTRAAPPCSPACARRPDHRGRRHSRSPPGPALTEAHPGLRRPDDHADLRARRQPPSPPRR